MQHIAGLILEGLQPLMFEESPDDRPLWKQKSSRIPYVRFTADIGQHISSEVLSERVELTFRKLGFEKIERCPVNEEDLWHIIIRTTNQESTLVIVRSDGNEVSVFMPS